jgi:hypothetical protein
MDFDGDLYHHTKDQSKPSQREELRTHVELLEEYNRQLDSIQQLQNKIK